LDNAGIILVVRVEHEMGKVRHGRKSTAREEERDDWDSRFNSKRFNTMDVGTEESDGLHKWLQERLGDARWRREGGGAKGEMEGKGGGTTDP
jgi:hypothetical protein